MSSAIYPDPPRLVTAVCGHGEQQRLSNARLRLTFYNGPVAYCGPARPGSAFQQSAVSGLLPRARARREIPLTFYNAPVAYCGPARPGSAFQQSAVSGLLPRARVGRFRKRPFSAMMSAAVGSHSVNSNGPVIGERPLESRSRAAALPRVGAVAL